MKAVRRIEPLASPKKSNYIKSYVIHYKFSLLV